MKKFQFALFVTAALLVIAVVGINFRFYQIKQHRDRLKAIGLHTAAIHYPEKIPEMIEMGMDVNALDASGETPLYQAVTFHKLESVQHLLAAGANPNIIVSHSLCPTALSRAAFTYHTPEHKKILFMLLEAGADPNQVGNRNETPFMHLLRSSHGDADASVLVQKFIDAGADLNLKDERGMTALQYAVTNGQPKAVDLLLKAGADSEQRNEAGFRAIDQINSVNKTKQEEIQDVFRKNGADAERRPELISKFRKQSK